MYLSDAITGCLLFLLLSYILIGYLFIRHIIWSIVWCEKGGKYNKLSKLKRGIGIIQRITMRYLSPEINHYKRPYLFWMNVKKAFIIAESIAISIYILCMFLWQVSIVVEIIMILINAQAFLLVLLMRFQFDINRNTKYDRIRIAQRSFRQSANSMKNPHH